MHLIAFAETFTPKKMVMKRTSPGGLRGRKVICNNIINIDLFIAIVTYKKRQVSFCWCESYRGLHHMGDRKIKRTLKTSFRVLNALSTSHNIKCQFLCLFFFFFFAATICFVRIKDLHMLSRLSYHLIFYVTRFSIGWNIRWIFVSIDLWRNN
jgi:hypothetical protein